MSEYQSGARKGKSTREHHLTIRAIKEAAKEKKEEITAVYFDIKKCFDKMVLKEAMKELWMKGVKGKHWRLIYKLNSNNILIPTTEIGECSQIKVKEMIKQGSVLGSVISPITIDSLTRIMNQCGNQWYMENIKINPLLFQDDIFAVNKTEHIQDTIDIIETFQDLKRLQFHEEKTKKSILNGKKDETIYINNVEIGRAEHHTYLGKIISEKTGEKEEISQRITKAKAAVNECMNIVNRKELKHKRIGIGKRLLQTVIIPTLIFGAETWPTLTEKEKENMNSIQQQYMNRILKLPKSTPGCAILNELDLMKIEHKANCRKLEYHIDLITRENTKLEVKINNYQEEKNMKYNREINELKKTYNINEDLGALDQRRGKAIVRKAIQIKNSTEIKESLNNGIKTKNIGNNIKYMQCTKFNEAQIIFKAKCGMLNIRENFKRSYNN